MSASVTLWTGARRLALMILTGVAGVIIALVVGACGSESTTAPASTPTAPPATAAPPAATAPPTATAAPPAATAPPTATLDPGLAVGGTADWSDRTQVADLGDGVTMAACDGDGPFLCITQGAELVGVVEGLRYPLASFSSLDPSDDIGGNLRAMAANFVESLRADRAIGCPPGYSLEAFAPTEFTLGGAEGLHYGYVGTSGDGSPSELNLQYATIDSGDIVLVTAIAYDEGGCPGRDDQSSFDSATLAALRPRLEAALSNMPLPPPRPQG